jgi:hypothetical protein
MYDPTHRTENGFTDNGFTLATLGSERDRPLGCNEGSRIKNLNLKRLQPKSRVDQNGAFAYKITIG